MMTRRKADLQANMDEKFFQAVNMKHNPVYIRKKISRYGNFFYFKPINVRDKKFISKKSQYEINAK